MASQGFQYPDPITAQAKVQANLAQPQAARDRATAVSDVDCKDKTNLVGIAVAVKSAYEKAYIDKHSRQLAAHKAWIEKIIRGDTGR